MQTLSELKDGLNSQGKTLRLLASVILDVEKVVIFLQASFIFLIKKNIIEPKNYFFKNIFVASGNRLNKRKKVLNMYYNL